MIARITLPERYYEPRTTIGGGTVRDQMPWFEAVSYVYDGERYGVEYDNGVIDWLGCSIVEAFGRYGVEYD